MEASPQRFEQGRKRETAGRTIAQSFCLIVGGGLVAVGVLGFIFAGTGFNTGDNIQGDEFILFEVNGWHNLVHIATGAFLLAMMPTARSAAMGALIFGALYVPVTVWGFIDGSAIANIVAINNADNWLHLGLAAAGLFAGITGGALTEAGRHEQREASEGVAREGRVATSRGRETTRRQ